MQIYICQDIHNNLLEAINGCEKMIVDIRLDTEKGEFVTEPKTITPKGVVMGLLKYAGREAVVVVLPEKKREIKRGEK